MSNIVILQTKLKRSDKPEEIFVIKITVKELIVLQQLYKSRRKRITRFIQLFSEFSGPLFLVSILDSHLREQLGSKREKENPKRSEEIPGICDG